MANHKSALKRNRQNVVRRARNRANKTKIKNAVKAVNEAIEENSVDNAKAALQTAIPVIMRAAAKGTIPKKTASRKVSRLTKRVNVYVAGQAA